MVAKENRYAQMMAHLHGGTTPWLKPIEISLAEGVNTQISLFKQNIQMEQISAIKGLWWPQWNPLFRQFHQSDSGYLEQSSPDYWGLTTSSSHA